jgi:hypothetical protein
VRQGLVLVIDTRFPGELVQNFEPEQPHNFLTIYELVIRMIREQFRVAEELEISLVSIDARPTNNWQRSSVGFDITERDLPDFGNTVNP